MPVHLDQLKSTFDSFSDAWRTNDGAAVASFFAEDGAIISPFGQRAEGRTAIAAMYSEHFGGMLRGHVDDLQSQQRPPGRGQPRVCRRRTDHPWPGWPGHSRRPRHRPAASRGGPLASHRGEAIRLCADAGLSSTGDGLFARKPRALPSYGFCTGLKSNLPLPS